MQKTSYFYKKDEVIAKILFKKKPLNSMGTGKEKLKILPMKKTFCLMR